MDLKQLYYFSQIAKCENMTKAANELFIAQSALSIALSNLEKKIGINLFKREKGKLVLNEYGRILLKHTDDILSHYNQALAEIEALKEKDNNCIRIGIIDEYYFKNMILAFMSSHPEINIIQSTISPNTLKSEQLIYKEYDFIIAPLPADYHGLSHDIIATDDLFLLVPDHHPLVTKEFAALSDINGEDLIIPGSGYSFHDFILHLLDKENIKPKSIKECVIPIIHNLVIDGSGIALGITNIPHFDPNIKGLRRVPLKTDIKRQKALFYSSETALTQAQKSFRDFVISYFNSQDTTL